MDKETIHKTYGTNTGKDSETNDDIIERIKKTKKEDEED